MEIEVCLKRVYGQERFYPKSNDAIMLCKLLKSQTLTKNQLLESKEGGWNVKVVMEEYKFV